MVAHARKAIPRATNEDNEIPAIMMAGATIENSEHDPDRLILLIVFCANAPRNRTVGSDVKSHGSSIMGRMSQAMAHNMHHAVLLLLSQGGHTPTA